MGLSFLEVSDASARALRHDVMPTLKSRHLPLSAAFAATPRQALRGGSARYRFPAFGARRARDHPESRLSDLFEEVEEQLRSERYRTLIVKVFPWVLGAGAVILAAGFVVWGWQKY